LPEIVEAVDWGAEQKFPGIQSSLRIESLIPDRAGDAVNWCSPAKTSNEGRESIGNL
jgi:hypothetical protein